MADNEEYFPRGGKKPTAKFYKQSSNFLGTIDKSEKKKSKPKKKSEGDDGYLSDEFEKEFDKSSSNCANGISPKTIKDGVLILGRVRQATQTKVQVSLPCRLSGSVMACHVSEPYNKILESYVNDKVDKVKELSTMFRVGQYVALRVLEVDKDELMLSMMPQHVNNIKHSDIYKGILLQAAVSSVEDHGYTMDLGISFTRAFLPKTHANADIELDTGMVTWCVVKSVTPSSDNSILTLSNQLQSLQEAVMKRDNGRKMAAILPGTAVEFTVDKALEQGLEGRVFNTTTSYIQRQHADITKGKKPSLGQRVRVRLLYDMPTRKTPFFLMRNIFETTYPDLSEEQRFKEGDIIEEAQVIKISGRSVIFKLKKKSLGVLSLKRIRVDEDLTDEEVVAKSYPLGTEHRVRVLCYNLLDFRYSVTDQPHLLQEKYFCYGDVQVGDLVDATVKTVHDTNIVMQVGRLTGKVTKIHMTDAGIYTDPKKGAISALLSKKKYKEGQVLKARVLHCDPLMKNIQLTLKPSFLSDDVVVLKSYDEAVVGNTYVGNIKIISSNYMLVSFFNHVTGYVSKAAVSTEPVDNLAEAFHVGQIVNCTVFKVDPENKKLIVSFVGLKPKRKFDKRNKDDDTKQEETDEHLSKKKKKRNDSESSEKGHKRKKDIKVEIIEESDAIASDIEEDSKLMLAPEDERLINLEQCITRSDYKKKITALKASIEKRRTRLEIVTNKIRKIKKKIGKSTKKDKLPAMRAELGVLKGRLSALIEALEEAENKLKDIPKKKKENKKADKKSESECEENKDLIKKNIKKLPLEEVKEKKAIKVAKGSDPALELPSVKDFWSTNAETLSKNVQDSKINDDLSSSDDEVKEIPKKKRKKLTPAEKVAKAREEENKLREMEKQAIDSQASPQSTEQFERALLANPNSSELWIAYMAFHLQSTEIERARAVAKKALSTINFREEQEKLNIWLAMINFEHRFGTKESQQKTLEDALQMNDTYKIHSSLLDLHADTNNPQELKLLVDLMMKKYRRSPAAYVACGAACYRVGIVDKARYVMQKAINLLDKKEHVSVLVQFALMERSSGAKERSEALFEQILISFPQRVDVCSTYVDMLFKDKDIERIRQLMERMTSHKLPARKMKVLFKKWIETEEKIGDSEQISKIRQKALEYIEKAQF